MVTLMRTYIPSVWVTLNSGCPFMPRQRLFYIFTTFVINNFVNMFYFTSNFVSNFSHG